MSSRQLHQLKAARDEVVRYSSELERMRANSEIAGLEHAILMHEKLHGKDEKELIGHIDNSINKIEEKQQAFKNRALAFLLTALVFTLAFSGAMIMEGSHGQPGTGLAVSGSGHDNPQNHDLDESKNSSKPGSETENLPELKPGIEKISSSP